MSTNNNNSAEIVVKSSIFQEREVEDDNYPDPSALPLPSQESRIVTDVTLSELIPGKYVSTTARVVYLRAIEKQDDLGSKMIFSGILEDASFKVPFVSHRVSYPLIRNCVYKFQSAYVHEFPSKIALTCNHRIYQDKPKGCLRKTSQKHTKHTKYINSFTIFYIIY
ncbi:MAG: hypothetical protein M3297_06335 [Thermoproteota archaeon]|nr:hypothetical protein [Thermoproteota archaeon]